MKEDMSEEELLDFILSNVPSLSRQEVEKMVQEYVSSLGISRKTALYLISLEYRVSPTSRIKKSLSLDELISGLSNVHIVGRIAWLSDTEKYSGGVYVRGGIMDNTSVLPIIFWNRDLNNLKDSGIEAGVPVEIRGCYTRPNLQGGIVIHVPERATIEVKLEFEDQLPTIDSFMKSPETIKTDEVIFTYGILLSRPIERNIRINGEVRTVRSFYIGYKDTVLKCSSWSSFPRKLDEIRPGVPIRLYYVKSRINRFNELELRYTKYSYIEPAYDLNIGLTPKETKLKNVKIGYNLNYVYLKAIAIGKTRQRNNSYVKNILVYDGDIDAVLSILNDKIAEFDILDEGDEFILSIFRASIREGFTGKYTNLFTTDVTSLEISKVKKFDFIIPTRNVKEITTSDRYINIRGRIVSIQEPNEGDIFGTILLEDPDREPFLAVYRNSLADYAESEINVGDMVELKAVLPDIQSLLIRGSYNPLKIRLRAFSKIVKI